MSDLYLDFRGTSFDELRSSLVSDSRESCAVLLGRVVSDATRKRILVTDVIHPVESDYLRRHDLAAVLNPMFVASVTRRARSQGKTLTFVHTHPFTDGAPQFSSADDDGEVHLAAYLKRQEQSGPHASLVLSRNGATARLLGSNVPARVRQIGSEVATVSGLPATKAHVKFDRQVRLVGERGQLALQTVRVAIVGMGGTGSVVAQELAYLGVRSLLLIDPDVIEESNLNRVVGAVPRSLGTPKVEVSRELVRSIAPSAHVDAVQGDVRYDDVAKRLMSCDLMFCCTDSHGSRAILNQIAYQYYLPCIDMGVAIVSDGSAITHIAGRIQLLSPTLPCLVCTSNINTDQVRYDLMREEQKKLDPYFLGPGEPAPAVISVNSTLSSLAVTMFLGVAAGLNARARYLHYNGVLGSLRPVHATPDPNCVVCSSFGALGRATTWPLPTISVAQK